MAQSRPQQSLLRHPLTFDYLGLVLLVLLTASLFLLPPFHRLFSLDDRRLQYPHADPERVTVLQCILAASVLPLLVISLTIVFSGPSPIPKTTLLHTTILCLLLSLAIAEFVTDLIKNTFGRPRPDLIARCKPAPDTPRNELVSWEVCTETQHHLLHDGWRSFPSGHSSFAFSGLGYLALWLRSQMKGGATLKGVICGLPMAVALLIAMSRTQDYRHDGWDVSAGASIGMAAAWSGFQRQRAHAKAAVQREGFERIEMRDLREDDRV